MAELTAKQEMFCQEYLVDLNASQAALRAGYSARTAASIGHENLRKPEIAERITALTDERLRRLGVRQDRILEELAALAFGRMDEVAPWDESGPRLIRSAELPPEKRALVQSIRVKREREYRGPLEATPWEVESMEIKLWDKERALDMLMRHVGGYAPEKREHSQDGPMVIEVKYVDQDSGG